MNPNSEYIATEKPTLRLLVNIGWSEVLGAFAETDGPQLHLTGRETLDEVVLVKYLRPALEKINTFAPKEAIDAAVAEMQRDRSKMSRVEANREIYGLLKNGFKTSHENGRGEREDIVVQIIDWKNSENNSFVAVNQFWILGRIHSRRPDIIGFVNGLPLIHIELKSLSESADGAYTGNIRDYKDTIPQLFWYNQILIISNGLTAKVGSMTAAIEHFHEWKRIDGEDETGLVNLETTIRATCEPTRALDIIENFILFSVGDGGETTKIIAKNHQYLGVNNTIDALMSGDDGKLGVFWHTQGAGKSFSMIFFAQKVMRGLSGNWSFVIVTDRVDLDAQIYKNFARSGATTETESETRASSVRDLREKLTQDRRYLFTLIHKFQNDDGQPLETISDRDDIIVMTDEAHRTQYATLALNMRNALPNAKFVGFTGTPLIADQVEKTKEVFGDYVSKYNFKQAVDDKATVPLFYENRIPELQLTNEQFDEDLEGLLDQSDLSEEQEEALGRQFPRLYDLITRESRLDRVAADIVEHYLGRGYQGKAMVVSIDRITAVRTHDKVKNYWQTTINQLEAELKQDLPVDRRLSVESQLQYMAETDMAVIVSQAQNEIDDFRSRGLDIIPHRERMNNEDLAEKFKNPNDPLRIAFVCAMWITGFDVQPLSTIYLDKPMRGHSLMQTIARANRVFAGKTSGLIVDYVGVFRDLKKALSIYGEGTGGEIPVRDKTEMLDQLRGVASRIDRYMIEKVGMSLEDIHQTSGFDRGVTVAKIVDVTVSSVANKTKFGELAGLFNQLFKSVLPDSEANEYLPTYQLLRAVEGQLKVIAGGGDIGKVSKGIEDLLDRSIEAGNYTINELRSDKTVDLSQIDLARISREIKTGGKNISVERLKGEINGKLKRLLELNKTRTALADKFKGLIDDYNAGSRNTEDMLEGLIAFTKELDEESRRAAREEMTEEELAVFDLIIRGSPDLNDGELKQVKKTARSLLSSLKQHKLVLDWKKSQQNRAIVERTIRDILREELPDRYDNDLQKRSIEVLYTHFYESYEDVELNIYAEVG